MTAAPSLLQTARALIVRDVQLLWRRRGDALQPALFALLVVVLFALGLGTSPQALSKVAPAVLWVAVLLAGLLSLDTLFRGDAEDGSLEQWILAPVPLAWLVLVRVLIHWATTALPLVLAAPLLGEMLHLPRSELPMLLATLALGTPLLSLLGAVVAALTVGMRRSGILVALLALPLYVPVLVFGAGAVAASAQGLDASGALLWLAAGLLLSLLLAPLAAAGDLAAGPQAGPAAAVEDMFASVTDYFRSGQRVCLVGAFALGQMGGGDVKLLTALALLATPMGVAAQTQTAPTVTPPAPAASAHKTKTLRPCGQYRPPGAQSCRCIFQTFPGRHGFAAGICASGARQKAG